MCFNTTLDPEHERMLLHVVQQLVGPDASKFVFADALLMLLEDISGFKAMSELASRQVVDHLWSKYRKGDTR